MLRSIGSGREGMSACDGITHDLLEIYKQYDAMGEAVVRWCRHCGAVVADRDMDNRTFPGYYMPMRFPKMTYPNQQERP